MNESVMESREGSSAHEVPFTNSISSPRSSTLTKNPKTWSFEDVQAFWQEDVFTLVSDIDMQQVLRPIIDKWCACLAERFIRDGEQLLEYVDREFVRDCEMDMTQQIVLLQTMKKVKDMAIVMSPYASLHNRMRSSFVSHPATASNGVHSPSPFHRASIDNRSPLQNIPALRPIIQSYSPPLPINVLSQSITQESLRTQQEIQAHTDAVPQTAPPRPSLIDAPPHDPPQTIATPPASEEVEQSPRPKKKRRIQVSETQPLQQSSALQVKNKSLSSVGHRISQRGRQDKLVLDDIFYGNTQPGEEIHFEPQWFGDISNIDEQDGSLHDRQDFSFVMPSSIHEHERRVVGRRMQYMLNTSTLQTTKVHGREVACFLPYPAHKKMDASIAVTVFAACTDGSYSAMREVGIATPNGLSILDRGMQSLGQDAVLVKLLKQYSDVLETDRDIVETDLEDHEQDGDQDEEDLDTGDDSGVEESDSEERLDKNKARSALDEVIQSMTDQWIKIRLPKIEAREARGLWDQAQRSRLVREQLIRDATDHLNDREKLHRRQYVDTIMVHDNERELRKVAVAMEGTLHEKLKWQWKIDVYKRKDAPPAPPPKTKRPAVRNHVNATHATSLADFIVPDDENASSRQSAPGTPHLDDAISNILASVKTPAKDETSDMDVDATDNDNAPQLDAETYGSGLLEQPMPQETPSSPPLEREVIEISSGSESEAVVARRSKRKRSSVMMPLAQEPVPTAKRKLAPKMEASHAPTPPLRISTKRKKEPATLDLGSAAIAALDINKLVRDKDKLRLLIKILHSQGEEYRKKIAEDAMPRQTFPSNLKTCLTKLIAIRHMPELHEQSVDEVECVDTACLYLAYMFARADLDLHTYSLNELSKALDNENLQVKFCDFVSECFRRAHVMFQEVKEVAKTDLLDQLSDDPKSDAAEIAETAISTVKANEASSSSDDEDISGKTGGALGTAGKAKARDAARKRKLAYSKAQSQQQSQASQPLNSSQSFNGEAPRHVINLSQISEAPVLINAGIAQDIKRHQVEGVAAIWREITAEVQDEEQVNGFLLAHGMGLGKTMQAITVLVTLCEVAYRHSEEARRQLLPHFLNKKKLCFLILCPPALIDNWIRELKQWDHKSVLGKTRRIDDIKQSGTALDAFKEWKNSGGVMIVSYHTFRSRVNKGERTQEPDKSPPTEDQIEFRKLATTTADMVILDEAQHIKNEKSKTSKVVHELTARARLALTGTPLSNAINEVYEIINFISPDYLADRSVFNSKFAIPIRDGLYIDASQYEHRTAIKRLKILRAEIDPKYSRYDIMELKESLQPKVEFMITLALSDVQRAAYHRLITALSDVRHSDDGASGTISVFASFHSLFLLLTHPAVFRTKIMSPLMLRKGKKHEEADDSDLDDDLSSAASTVSKTTVADPSGRLTHGFSRQTALAVVGDIQDDLDAALSAKATIFLEIVRLTLEAGDKLLVFSSYVLSLDYLGKLLKGKVNWGRIDGTTNMKERQKLIGCLEDGDLEVMLISTRAGGVGLNMQCANRVVIFDSSLNPSHEQQAIGRAYRIGQTKPVFVYHLMTGGTFEDNLHNMQLLKLSLSQRVVDKKDYERRSRRRIEGWLYKPKDVQQSDVNNFVDKDPQVMDHILKAQAARGAGIAQIYAMKTTETLEKDATDEKLEPDEEAEVQQQIDENKNLRKSARIANAKG